MALFIKDQKCLLGEYGWHIGEPVPEVGRVVTFQADGDELNLFLDAMLASRGEHPRVDYQKMAGFKAIEPTAEYLAEQLHREYRAAFKALHSGRGSFMGVGRVVSKQGTGCRSQHDHGWEHCHRKDYFLRRAKRILTKGWV
jgi:hypothetical protein